MMPFFFSKPISCSNGQPILTRQIKNITRLNSTITNEQAKIMEYVFSQITNNNANAYKGNVQE